MRLIDADALKEQMESVCMGIMAGTDSYNAPLKTIDDAPTVDAVEVVRCRECKHYQYIDSRAFGWAVKCCVITGFEDVDDDDFCSRGERKE